MVEVKLHTTDTEITANSHAKLIHAGCTQKNIEKCPSMYTDSEQNCHYDLMFPWGLIMIHV